MSRNVANVDKKNCKKKKMEEEVEIVEIESGEWNIKQSQTTNQSVRREGNKDK